MTPAGLQDSNHKANLSQYNLPWLLQMYKHPSVGLLERFVPGRESETRQELFGRIAPVYDQARASAYSIMLSALLEEQSMSLKQHVRVLAYLVCLMHSC